MKTLKRFTNLVLVLFVLSFAQQLRAATLPPSSYATAQNNWQGSKNFNDVTNDGTINCRINYAVYDTTGNLNTGEAWLISSISQQNVIEMSQYLYVYQILNDQDNSDAAITSFAVHALNNTAINISSQSISAADDSAGGIEPGDSGLATDGKKVVWNFATAAIMKGDHSWYLVLSSDGGPVKGAFDLSSSASDEPSPTPEPATIALLSVGGMFFVGQKRRK